MWISTTRNLNTEATLVVEHPSCAMLKIRDIIKTNENEKNKQLVPIDRNSLHGNNEDTNAESSIAQIRMTLSVIIIALTYS